MVSVRKKNLYVYAQKHSRRIYTQNVRSSYPWVVVETGVTLYFSVTTYIFYSFS